MAGVPKLPGQTRDELNKLRREFEEKNFAHRVPYVQQFLRDLEQLEREDRESLLHNRCLRFLEELDTDPEKNARKADVEAMKKTIQNFLLPRSEGTGNKNMNTTIGPTSNRPELYGMRNKSQTVGPQNTGNSSLNIAISSLSRESSDPATKGSQQSSGDTEMSSGKGVKHKSTVNVVNHEELSADGKNQHDLFEKRSKELEETIKERDQLESSISPLNQTIQRLKDELEQRQAIVAQFETNAHKSYEENQGLHQENEGLKKKLEAFEAQEQDFLAERDQTKKRMKYYEDHIKALERQHKERERGLTAERDDLRNRYSKLAGQALKDNNSDISDLSDANRPMKLGEKFSELYDNEWTDIFQAQVDTLKRSEKEAIQILLQALEECYKFCKDLAEKQLEMLKNVFLYHCQDPKKTFVGGSKPRLHSKEEKSLLEVRKMIGASNTGQVKQSFLDFMAPKADKLDGKLAKEFTAYYEKCTEVCWVMALNDPPLYMDMESKSGKKIDMNLYTPYYTGGDKADFLVWPPLFNVHKGGLINKGVVAPVMEKKKIKK